MKIWTWLFISVVHCALWPERQQHAAGKNLQVTFPLGKKRKKGKANCCGILNVTYYSQRWLWAVLYTAHLSSLISVWVFFFFVPGDMRQCGVVGKVCYQPDKMGSLTLPFSSSRTWASYGNVSIICYSDMQKGYVKCD